MTNRADPKGPVSHVPPRSWGKGPVKAPAQPWPSNVGDGFALLDEYFNHRFKGLQITTPHFKALNHAFSKVWSAYEIYQFVSSRGKEQRGDMLALLAELVAWQAQRQITNYGVVSLGSATRFVLGKAFVVAWTGYEMFQLGQALRGKYEMEKEAERAYKEAREFRYDKWESHMRENLWAPLATDTSRDLRENAFQQMTGGKGTQSVIPSLTDEAARDYSAMTRQISRDWLDRMDKLPHADGWGAGPQEKIQAEHGKFEAASAADMKRATEHLVNPANWNLTESQRAQLAPEWQERFDRRDELEGLAMAGVPGAREDLHAHKREMEIEAAR